MALDTRSTNWADAHVEHLLQIWSCDEIQQKFRTSVRNQHIYEIISHRLSMKGIHRTPEQCRNKVKGLKHEYYEGLNRPAGKKGPLGISRQARKFYACIDAVIKMQTTPSPPAGAVKPAPGPQRLTRKPILAKPPQVRLSEPQANNTAKIGVLASPTDIDITMSEDLCYGGTADRGCIWTDEEVEELLDTWGLEHMQQELKSNARNMHIYKSIARVLQQRGIERTGEQCRSKIKQLKRGYKMLANGEPVSESSGLMRQLKKYYPRLDVILKEELGSKSDGKMKVLIEAQPCPQRPRSASETTSPTEGLRESTSLDMVDSFEEGSTHMQSPGDRGMTWTDGEVDALLALWGQDGLQEELAVCSRNKHIFERLSESLQAKGFERTALQCYKKIKQLNIQYHKFVGSDLKEAPRQIAVFFPRLHKVLTAAASRKSTEEDGGSKTSEDEMDVEWQNSSPATPTHGAQGDPKTGLPAFLTDTLHDDTGSEGSTQDRVRMMIDRGAVWTDEEVEDLLEVWSKESIQSELCKSQRNLHIFTWISLAMERKGHNRTPQQCRGKIKSLKTEYNKGLKGKDKNKCTLSRQGAMYSDQLHIIQQRKSGRLQYTSTEIVCQGDMRDSPLKGLGSCQDLSRMRSVPTDMIKLSPNSRSGTSLSAEGKLESGGMQGMGMSQDTNEDSECEAVHAQGPDRETLWSEEEMGELVEIWGCQEIQQLLTTSPYNQDAFQQVAEEMQERGYERTVDQCIAKVKAMRKAYLRCLRQGLGEKCKSRETTMFRKLHAVFGSVEGRVSPVPVLLRSVSDVNKDSADLVDYSSLEVTINSQSPEPETIMDQSPHPSSTEDPSPCSPSITDQSSRPSSILGNAPHPVSIMDHSSHLSLHKDQSAEDLMSLPHVHIDSATEVGGSQSQIDEAHSPLDCGSSSHSTPITSSMSQDLYSASGVVPPSVNDVTRVANKLGLQLTQEDALSYQKIMGKFFQGFKILDELPEPALPVKYQRTPGYRPGPEENPHNAWYYKTDIQGAAEGKLAGRTVAIKDNVAVAGVPMMNGSKIFEGYTPEFDATVVTRLLDAGARIVGKSSCEDMCFSGSSVTSTYGPVPNFHHDRHSSGGSSSGSGYLVASGEVDLAVGGDQGGSIRIPASWCGIVGLKPTHGLIPYTGAASIEATMDHLGPMARTVYDCALMLEVMAGYDGGLDPRQPCNLQIPAYTQALNGDLGKVRVGIVKEGFEDCEEDVKSMVMEAANKLKQCGAHVEEVSIPMHKEGLTIWAAVFHEGHYNCIVECSGTTLGNRGFYATSLADTLSKGFQTKINEVSAPFKLGMLMGGYMRDRYHNHYYCKGQNLIRLLTQAYDVALHEYDVLVMPTIKFKAPRIPPADASLEDFINHCLNMCGNVATFDATGHPALTINTGFSGGLPVGMMVIGKHFDETSVLKVAGAYETMRNMKQEVE